MIKPTMVCVTGSAMVPSVEPNDYDYVCYFDNRDNLIKFVEEHGGCTPEEEVEYGDTRFTTCREGKHNFICTDDIGLYWRTVAFSGILQHMQISDKSDRVQMAVACMDWEPRDYHLIKDEEGKYLYIEVYWDDKTENTEE
jgi:hypothetical protein